MRTVLHTRSNLNGGTHKGLKVYMQKEKMQSTTQVKEKR